MVSCFTFWSDPETPPKIHFLDPDLVGFIYPDHIQYSWSEAKIQTVQGIMLGAGRTQNEIQTTTTAMCTPLKLTTDTSAESCFVMVLQSKTDLPKFLRTCYKRGIDVDLIHQRMAEAIRGLSQL